jgi:ABC-2 type transport system ATP-binding protein
MAAPAVRVATLNKTFFVPERDAGLRASVQSLFKRRHREVRAVDGISFEIESGEIVGFLGPNVARRACSGTCPRSASGSSFAGSRW